MDNPMKAASIILIASLSLLPGCATTANYEATLKTWIGSTEDQLVSSWGPPTSTYETGNSKYLTYTRSSQGYIPGQAPSYQTTYYGNTAYTTPVGGSEGFAYTAICKTTFTIQNDRIVNWRWEGNSCRSR
jgi:hypothetical protein